MLDSILHEQVGHAYIFCFYLVQTCLLAKCTGKICFSRTSKPLKDYALVEAYVLTGKQFSDQIPV